MLHDHFRCGILQNASRRDLLLIAHDEARYELIALKLEMQKSGQVYPQYVYAKRSLLQSYQIKSEYLTGLFYC